MKKATVSRIFIEYRDCSCDTFEPSAGSKFYVLKQNRGLRPFVVLNAEDLIYF